MASDASREQRIEPRRSLGPLTAVFANGEFFLLEGRGGAATERWEKGLSSYTALPEHFLQHYTAEHRSTPPLYQIRSAVVK
jgi:hypothetical protein